MSLIDTGNTFDQAWQDAVNAFDSQSMQMIQAIASKQKEIEQHLKEVYQYLNQSPETRKRYAKAISKMIDSLAACYSALLARAGSKMDAKYKQSIDEAIKKYRLTLQKFVDGQAVTFKTSPQGSPASTGNKTPQKTPPSSGSGWMPWLIGGGVLLLLSGALVKKKKGRK